jgi:CRISPR/Cas system-associated exonuclease Cas4 (RecB family)
MSQLVRANEHIALNRAFGTQELNDLLEKAMKRESKFTTKKSFAPSGLGYSGSCPRYWHYAFNGATFEYDTQATAVANMDAGTDAGQRLANLLDKAGILVEAEREVNTIENEQFPPIRGYIDAVVNWKDEEVLVEVKTTNDGVWNNRMVNNTVPGYQLVQLLIYMYVTNHNKGFFLTENKNTHEIFIYPVKMNDEHKALVEGIFDWMRMVKDNAENGELPIRPFSKSSMQCKGCPVKNTCWEGWTRGKVNGTDPNPGVVDLPPLEIPK